MLVRLPGMEPTYDPSHALLPASELVWRGFLAALDALPPDARAVLLLHDVLGAGFDDIVPLLGLPLSTCRQRLAQARASLRAHRDHLEPGTS